MVVARQGQVHAVFLEDLVPASELRSAAVRAEKPLVVLTDQLVAGIGIVLQDFLHPGGSRGESRAVAHRLVVEHDEQGVAVAEPVADPFFARIAVAGIGRRVAEEIVRELVAAGHVVVVAVERGPHVVAERLFLVHLHPERIAAAPGADIAQVEHPVILVVRTDGIHHLHGRFEPARERRIAVEVGDDAGIPLPVARRPETIDLASGLAAVRPLVRDVIAVVRPGLEAVQRQVVFQETGVLVEVLPIGLLGPDGVVNGAVAAFRLQGTGLFPAPVTGFRQRDAAGSGQGIAPPAEPHLGRGILPGAGRDAENVETVQSLRKESARAQKRQGERQKQPAHATGS